MELNPELVRINRCTFTGRSLARMHGPSYKKKTTYIHFCLTDVIILLVVPYFVVTNVYFIPTECTILKVLAQRPTSGAQL
jgi:hypothetical protein